MDNGILKNMDGKSAQKRHEQATTVVNLGLFANAVLAVVKVTAGIFGRSKALLADGINSVSDVVYFIFVKLLVGLSGQPADEEHPYGHHQYESIAAVVIGAFVITTGIAIFWDSVNSIFQMLTGAQEKTQVELFSLFVAIGTICAKLGLLFQALSVSRKTGNIAIGALARDHRNDIFASLGAAIGILLSLLGLNWVDPLAGALVAVIVAKTGIDILRESTSDLMDTVPSKEMDLKVREVIRDVADVKVVESVHTHKFGPYYSINITIGIDGNLNVYNGNKISDTIEALIYEKIDMVRRVYIHYHPADTNVPKKT
jgi:cation diffusion facilitator family transporter